MKSTQQPGEQSAKSRGEGENDAELNHLSRSHADGRVDSGFKLVLLVAEYRALRASVIRLWRESLPNPSRDDLADLTRFNESIDESLTQAIATFTDRLDRSRQMFLAILGHDLRNPLNSITLSTQVLALNPMDKDTAETVAQISTSAKAMAEMIADLLDFAGAALTGTIPIAPAPMDMRSVCEEVVHELEAAHPGSTVHLNLEGDLRGKWDPHRLRQVIGNLVGNALQHGDGTVNIAAVAEDRHTRLTVKNTGDPIPPDLLPTIFDPLVSGAASQARRNRRSASMGLGLYIARAIVSAHDGDIHVESSQDAGTTFEVSLPRRA
jgi:signal transduction histidine kinase